MTEDEFLEYINKLWSMLIWGNKKYVVDKLIADNGFVALEKQLAEFLYGTSPIEKRWDIFLNAEVCNIAKEIATKLKSGMIFYLLQKKRLPKLLLNLNLRSLLLQTIQNLSTMR